jgi:hypothetical protein
MIPVGILTAAQNTLSGFLLNDYPNAAAAYSLRLLRSLYTGFAIRVRRSSDNLETNIGFIGNVLDTVTLLSFCGASNGFISIWYDQSGNSNNCLQTTNANQPQIVSSGVLITNLSKPSIRYTGSPISLLSTTPVDPLFITAVNKPNTTAVFQTILGADTSDVIQIGSIYATYSTPSRTPTFARANINDTFAANSFNATGSSPVSNNVTNLYTGARTFNSISVFINNTNVGNGTNVLSLRPVGGTDGGNFRLMAGYYNSVVVDYFAGDLQEIILYTTDQSTNRTGINTNINTFYSIY